MQFNRGKVDLLNEWPWAATKSRYFSLRYHLRSRQTWTRCDVVKMRIKACLLWCQLRTMYCVVCGTASLFRTVISKSTMLVYGEIKSIDDISVKRAIVTKPKLVKVAIITDTPTKYFFCIPKTCIFVYRSVG